MDAKRDHTERAATKRIGLASGPARVEVATVKKGKRAWRVTQKGGWETLTVTTGTAGVIDKTTESWGRMLERLADK